MSSRACHVTECVHSSGYRMVRLENECIAVTVIPEKGAEIRSFEYLPLGIDVLWKAPWGLRKGMCGVAAGGSSSEMAWMDHYTGGWQTIFPNGGESCIYRGAHHNFHGEASVVAWNYKISEDATGGACVVCDTVLARTPFSLRRSLRLVPGTSVLHIEETITNHGADEMEYMWGHHPALGAPFLSADCRLQVPAKRFQPDKAAESVAWSSEDHRPPTGVDARTETFGYLTDFDAGWYSIFNGQLGLGFALAWPVEVFPNAWLWQEFGGTRDYPWYGRTYVMAIEPFSTIPALGLAHAASIHTAASLGPGQTRSVALAATLFREERIVRSFNTAGDMEFEM